jgi:aryl-alcohol dehydrogenase-like predicted oxidoreductase
MQYRKLGKWGVKVSEVALGSWLTYGGTVGVKDAVEQFEYALSLGINFFDTANVYAHGQAEEIVGKAISTMQRDAIFLATKVYFPMGDGPNDRGLSRKHVFEQCHASLKRLNTSYIDLYQCHRYDSETPLPELVRTMDDLTRQGKILYWGVSEWSAQQIEAAVTVAEQLNAPPPVSNQPFYNLLHRDIEKAVIPTCRELGIGQVVFSPLAQGVLTGKYKSGAAPSKDTRAGNDQVNMFMLNRNLYADQNLEKVQRLGKLASELGITTAQLALAWCLRLPELSSVIIGATRKEQIKENAQASGIELDDATIKKIESVFAVKSLA